MVRLFAFLSALLIALAAVSLAIYGADRLLPVLVPLTRHRWLASLVGVFVPVCVSIGLAMKKQPAKPDEDDVLTPRVRRQSSGMREL